MHETKYTTTLTAETEQPELMGRLIHAHLVTLRSDAAAEVAARIRKHGYFHGEVVATVTHPAGDAGVYVLDVVLRDFGLPTLPLERMAGELSHDRVAVEAALAELLTCAAEAAVKPGKKKVEFPATTDGRDATVTVEFK